MDKKSYKKMVHNTVPPSPKIKNMLFAFLFGGGICTLGQVFRKLYIYLGASEENAPTLVAITLVAIAAILTALGVFDKIARYEELVRPQVFEVC